MLIRRLKYCQWLNLILGFLLVGFIKGDCPFPEEEISNGEYRYVGSKYTKREYAREMDILRYKCSIGYKLIGQNVIQCVDEEWTDDPPICERMLCSDPPKIENGTYSIQGDGKQNFAFGTQIIYSCNAGYEIRDPSDSHWSCILNEDGNDTLWAGKVPVCDLITPCPDPGVSVDGSRAGDCCQPGSVLRFSCNEAFELVGAEEIQCLPSKSWSSRRPLCRPTEEDHCQLPPKIPHGTVTGVEGDYFRPDEEAHVLCEPGFKFSGPDEFILCDENSQWDTEFGDCIEIFCDLPPPLDNGTILELESIDSNASLPYNFLLTYVCNEGFRLVGGDSWRMCRKDGWSGSEPYCKEIYCPDPGIPENGGREGNSFKVGEKVLFKCSTGYELLGSLERYCKPNGQWTGELARCNVPTNYCPNPGRPVNGFKNGESYDVGDFVRFSCEPGYIQSGSEIRKCLLDGSWDGTEAKCLGPYDYDSIKEISEIMKAKLDKRFDEDFREWKAYKQASVGMRLARMLDLNYQGRTIIYFAFDVSGSVNERNFRDSIQFAKAIVRKVGISEEGSRAGALTFSNKAENVFLPRNLHTTEQVLEALDGIQYTGGGTSASSALATIRANIILDDRIDEQEETVGQKKNVLFIITDGKANMGGNPIKEADILKKLGVEIFCIGITGDVRKKSLYEIASTSTYGNEERPNVFILKNYASLHWLIQDITNGTLDYSQCGLGLERLLNNNRGRIVGGKKSKNHWPWMAALYYLDPLNKGTPAELKCGGSIINEKFILTAAHCMYEEKDSIKGIYRLRNEDEISVKLGITDIKNETLAQEFGIKKIRVHRKYVFGPLFDYDIALLELARPIMFGPFVRPICLPPLDLPPDSPLYKPREFGWVAGWGHEGKVDPNENVHFKVSQNLKQLRLPIQPKERCLTSLTEKKFDPKYFTENMFCAGDGMSGNDTCRGDSGGPLMQHQMNKDGHLYWTQVGLVSWGVGCGQKDLYGYYTNVQQFRSWLDEIINRKPELEEQNLV